MMCSKKISSLKEKALCKIAISLAQDNMFKEIAMCLEKPTYGFFMSARGNGSPSFVSDPKLVSAWTDRDVDDDLTNILWDCLSSSYVDKLELWNEAVEEQCRRLTKGLPSSITQELHVCLNKLALECLSYCRRQESLFGVSRYFLMNILTEHNWTEAGRLNEEKIAKQLVKDEQLTILQRYYIACDYCLHIDVSGLWNKLSEEDKQSAKGDIQYNGETSYLTFVWSNYMSELESGRIPGMKQCFGISAVEKAIERGNKTAVVYCWKKMHQNHQKIVIEIALLALEKSKIAQISYGWKKKLFSNDPCSPSEVPDLILPYFYIELVHFFLSEMSEKQILTFLRKAFKKEGNKKIGHECIATKTCILEYLLDWPLQGIFLRTVNSLWRAIPKSEYGLCLHSLAYRYSGEYQSSYSSSPYKRIDSYDYGSVLLDLWKQTPKNYKKYIFYNNTRKTGNYIVIQNVLFQLLKRCKFEEEDVALFKEIWHDVPQEFKKAMLVIREPQMRFRYGDDICWTLLENKKWSLAHWLLEENFSQVEIPSLKKKLIETRRFECFAELRQKCFEFVEDLINWCLESDAEKTEFKSKLLYDVDDNDNNGLDFCSISLGKGDFATVQNLINFCISSDELKEEFKVECGRDACRFLLEDCEWELMDKVLTWCYAKEEEISDYKKFLFDMEGTSLLYRLIFYKRDLRNVCNFYKCFCLSPEEINKLKNEIMFMPETIAKVHKALYDDIDEIEPYLYWGLVNKEMLVKFKAAIQKQYFDNISMDEDDERAMKCLDYLINECFKAIEKRNKVEKRYSVIEDGSSLAKRIRIGT